MGELIFGILKNLVNFIYNILLTPIFTVIGFLFPNFQSLVDKLTEIFDTYIWQYYNFIPVFLKTSLHIPNEIFVIIADFLTLVLYYWTVIKGILIFKNLYGYIHGNFKSEDSRKH